MRVLIIGYGYVGQALGEQLAQQGHQVFGIRKTMPPPTSAELPGIQLFSADITQPETLAPLPKAFDWVVNTVSAGRGGAEEYREVYLQGMRHVLAWLRDAPPQKFVYTSSTGVYGQKDGSQVKEDSPAQPPTETGQVLLETEALLLEAARTHAFPAVILRVAGIYGPERGYWLRQFLAGEARLEGKGERYLNMIHRDDLVGIIIAALKNGRIGEIYNAVDDEPVTQFHLFRWLADTLGQEMPPVASPATTSESKRGSTHKKVLNRKLKMELGYTFKYPNFRHGYTAEIQRLDLPPSSGDL